MGKDKAALTKIVEWIRSKVPANLGILVPVSGGSDSALCWWLCNKALPKRTLGVFSGNGLRREDWFRKFGELRFIEAPISGKNPEIVRWADFLALSIQERKVLVGTRNRTEDIFGAYSLASRLATMLPISGIWKSDVVRLCKVIRVPDEIINSSRQADPACGRPAELSEIPLESVDSFLKMMKGEEGASSYGLTQEELDYLHNLYLANQFKKYLPEKGPDLNPLG